MSASPPLTFGNREGRDRSRSHAGHPRSGAGQSERRWPFRKPHGNPETWGTLNDALWAAEEHKLDGVGKVFHDDNDLIGIDLDRRRDTESGEVEMWVLNIVSKLDTYAEVSPSGTGIKLWLYGTLPGARRRNDAQGVEMYDTKRFFTVTGCRLPDAPPACQSS